MEPENIVTICMEYGKRAHRELMGMQDSMAIAGRTPSGTDRDAELRRCIDHFQNSRRALERADKCLAELCVKGYQDEYLSEWIQSLGEQRNNLRIALDKFN